MNGFSMTPLVVAVLEGDCTKAVSQAGDLRASRVRDILRHGIEPVLAAVDSRCTLEPFNLLELTRAGCERLLLLAEASAGLAWLPERPGIAHLAQASDFADLFLDSLYLQSLHVEKR